MLASTVFSILTLQSDVHLAKATGTIYIRADGSVDPPMAAISTIDNITYTFRGDIFDGIIVERSNITIDGAGHTLQGNGEGFGILLYANNITVKNTNVKMFDTGILTGLSSNCDLILGNNFTENGDGIWIGSSSNYISGNNVSSNSHYGIWLCYTSNNVLRNNIMADNLVMNFAFASGGELSSFLNDVDSSNTVNGKPIYYWINKHDLTVPSDAGYVALINCTGITVQGSSLDNNSDGVLAAYTTDTTIINNSINANRYYGIFMHNSSNNSIIGNNITASIEFGIFLGYSSDFNNIHRNNIINDRCGLEVLLSSNVNATENNFIANHVIGISFYESTNNSVYHNNFVNNRIGISYGGHYSLDAGYPSGGNYWSDYSGLDLYQGIFQNETGSDGIGDVPYTIDANNGDRYPLVKPYGVPHDIGTPAFNALKTAVGQGYCMEISVSIVNYGMQQETFNLTILMNSTTIYSQTMSLASRNFTIITVAWNTTDCGRGNYTIKAILDIVLGETDATDNTRESGTLLVGVPCDVTGPTQGVPDGVCDMRDIGHICSKFATTPPSPNWDPNVDVTGPTPRLPDGTVNMRDIGEACNNFMKT